MGRNQSWGAIHTPKGPQRQSVQGRAVPRLRRSRFGLGLIGILITAVGIAQPLAAQGQTSRRLTLRPREMATGTRTERAGEQELELPAIQWTNAEAPPAATVYVPEKCVGAVRCPLLVFAWTSDGEDHMDYIRPMADKYGILLLLPGTRYYNLGGSGEDAAATEEERQHLDATLKQVLQQFAVDPDKIAIMGTCATGRVPVNIGGDNYEVFNRIISLSGAPSTFEEVDPPSPKVEFFFDAGIDESQGYFKLTRAMRGKGYQVTHAFGLRVHGHQHESYDHVGRWLTQTWASPDSAARPAPRVIADPLPLLTIDVLAKMTAFWTRFLAEPDSIRMTGRQAHLQDVAVPVGNERRVVVLTDMAALAAAYPEVTADLKAAGLTAQEHDAYRVALVNARVLKNSAGDMIGTLDPASPQAKNVAFMEAHPDEFQALEDASNGYARHDTMQVPANMWSMP